MSNITLNDAIDEYLTSRRSRGLAENTLKGDRVVLMRLLAGAGNIYAKSLEPRHIDAFFAASADLKDSSRNMMLTRIRGFVRWCKARNYMKNDPTLDRARVREAAPDYLFVPVEQFDDLLDAATHPRDRIVVALGMYLFLRNSEIRTLRVGDVDLDNSEVHVTIHKTKDRDVMPISTELDNELRRWLQWYAENLDVPLSGDMYLVPTKHDYRSLPGPNGKFEPSDTTRVKVKPYKSVARPYVIVQRALQGVGYPTKGEGGHTLRRSGARALFDVLRSEEGIDGALQAVKVMLHHKNVSMTEHYLGIAPERAQRDARLKGKTMFVRPEADNVVQLWRVDSGDKAGSRV